MAAIVMAATVSGRPTSSLVVLGVATGLVILLRPAMVHSVGLQLSVAATAGIVREITGKRRQRVYAYTDYLAILSEGTEPLPR